MNSNQFNKSMQTIKNYVDSKVSNTDLIAQNTSSGMEGLKLACIGDSITAGTGCGASNIYAYKIKEAENLGEIQQLGYPSEGYQTICNYASLINDANDIIIEFAGVNNRDASFTYDINNFDTATVEGAVNTMFKELKERFADKGKVVLICTPIQPCSNTLNYQNIHNIANLKKQYAEYYGLPVCDIFTNSYFKADLSDEEKAMYISDGIHPTSEGHQLLANLMLDSLRELIITEEVQLKKKNVNVYPLTKEKMITDDTGISLTTKIQSILERLSVLENSGSSAIPVISISLNKSTTTISAGSSDTLVATIEPSNATNQNIIWTTSNKDIATVNNGVVNGIAEGSCIITACSASNTNIKATCDVVVKPSTQIDGIVQDGIVCWLDATTGVANGGTVWSDRTSNGNNATILEGNTIAVADNKKVTISKAMTMPHTNIPQGTKTYEFVYAPRLTWNALFFCGDKTCIQSCGNPTGYLMVNGSNTSYLVPYDNPIIASSSSGYKHLTVIMEANKVTFYDNGQLLGTYEKDLSGILNFSSDLVFNNRYNGSEMRQTDIFAFRIYNRKLSDSEILNNYNADVSKYR